MAEITVVDNVDKSRYELRIDGECAGIVRYRRRDGTINLLHTEVDAEYEGQGLGGKLAAGVLDAVRASGERAIVTCPFIAGYIRRHPEYADLMPEEGA
jgi:predicted GNAT family acetyltransferase